MSSERARENSRSRIAVITGGSRGLGRNTVMSLARRGVDSIFTYNSNRTEADKVLAEVAATGRKGVALQLDTGKASSFDALVLTLQHALDTSVPSASTIWSTMPAPPITKPSRKRRKKVSTRSVMLSMCHEQTT